MKIVVNGDETREIWRGATRKGLGVGPGGEDERWKN